MLRNFAQAKTYANDGGPAADAKLRNGDVILKFNGQDVKEMRSLPRIVAETDIGKDVPVLVWRDGRELTLTAKVGEMPDDQKQAAAADPAKPAEPKGLELADLGLKLEPITAETRDKYQLTADQKGVLITEVASGTPAADKGLKPGDVIVEVQQEEVATPADVQDRVEKTRKSSRKSVLMLVQNADGLKWVPLSLAPNERKRG